MSLRRPAAALPPHPHAERVQREHELSRALEAARTLQARLEMLDGHEADVRSIRELRNKIVGEFAQLGHLILDDEAHQSYAKFDHTSNNATTDVVRKVKGDKPIVGNREGGR